MLQRQYRSLKTTASLTKRDFYKQHFYIHQPLLQQIIEAKLQKCLKYGHLRENNQNSQKIARKAGIHVIEAPCIQGNRKKIGFRLQTSRKSLHDTQFKQETRPKTSNTVIRSRTTEPRVREKLKLLLREEREEEGFEENLRPTLHIRRFQEGFQ